MKKLIVGGAVVAICLGAGGWIWTGVHIKNTTESAFSKLKSEKNQPLLFSYDALETSVLTHCSTLKNVVIETLPEKGSFARFKMLGDIVIKNHILSGESEIIMPQKSEFSFVGSEEDFPALVITGTNNYTIKYNRSILLNAGSFTSAADFLTKDILKGFSAVYNKYEISNAKTSEKILVVDEGASALSLKDEAGAKVFVIDSHSKGVHFRMLWPTTDPQTGKMRWTLEPEMSMQHKTDSSTKLNIRIAEKDWKQLLSGKKPDFSMAALHVDEIKISGNLGESMLKLSVDYTPESVKVKMLNTGKTTKQAQTYFVEFMKNIFEKAQREQEIKTGKKPQIPINALLKLVPDFAEWGEMKAELDVNVPLSNPLLSQGTAKISANGIEADISVPVPGKTYQAVLKLDSSRQFIHAVGDLATGTAKVVSPEMLPLIEMNKAAILDLAPKFITKSDDSRFKDMLTVSFDLLSGIHIGPFTPEAVSEMYVQAMQKAALAMMPAQPTAPTAATTAAAPAEEEPAAAADGAAEADAAPAEDSSAAEEPTAE